MKRKRHHTTATEVMRFLENFGVYRSGNYDVPRPVLKKALIEFIETGELEYFLQWEEENV